ncbi:hypothetical protein Leryth_018428 [Lithospermum erythrorhizon]|nr:hypothetical protein Leryth_018428 [Lithospermum erythrorhizon]
MAGEGGYRRRGGGDERFYCPPAMRAMYNQQKQRYNQQQNGDNNVVDRSISYSKKGKPKGGSKESSNNRIEFDDGASLTTTSPSIAPSPLSNNLDRFLEYSTPAVIAQKFPKTSMKGWKNSSDEFHPHFVLGDLWECFGEWSAYGAGVPLLLNGSDSVVQYYVPSLSGIQLYIDPSKPFIGKKKHDESDGDSSRETSSDSSCEAVPDMGAAIQRFNSHSLRNNHFMGPSADDSDVSNQPGVLVYQHLEPEPPPRRKPLSEKISEIVSDHPQVKLLRSCDLTPASWLSVAWYPIYRIPIGPTLHNVEACFLTYHSLSTPIRSSSCHLPHHQASTTCRGVDDGISEKLLVPAFGLSSYKLNIPVWGLDGEGQKLNSLLQAAENWLRLLQVNHPDYNFFMSRRVNFR